jgi:hypothetical protein
MNRREKRMVKSSSKCMEAEGWIKKAVFRRSLVYTSSVLHFLFLLSGKIAFLFNVFFKTSKEDTEQR